MLAIDIDFKENNIIIPFLQQDIYTHKTNNNNENEPKENENKI
jgi:small-conductance mechanosensitive channel